MEQLEIHSKSYLVRWVNVKAGHTISWSIQPHKKSINFGIFKHPGPGVSPTPKLPSSTFEVPPTPSLVSQEAAHSHNASWGVIEKLKGIGLKLISWHGTCEGSQISSGHHDVSNSEEGMYALVFDNTFAKQFSKTVTFVLLTYPIDSPPVFNHQVHHIQGSTCGSTSSLNPRSKGRPKLHVDQRKSSDSLQRECLPALAARDLPGSLRWQEGHENSTGSYFHTGILQKRRRKKHQGYARRFFTLDFTSSTLSYYHDRHTLALRGAIPLSLAAIGANTTTREISIDSGAEVWHLKALNQRDFEAWRHALEVASRALASQASPIGHQLDPISKRQSMPRTAVDEEREWAKMKSLIGRVAGSRDLARRLAKDTDPKYLTLNMSNTALAHSMESVRTQDTPSTEESSTEQINSDEYFQGGEHWSFWKRKLSSGRPNPIVFKRSVSAQPTIPSPKNKPNSSECTKPMTSKNQTLHSFPEDDVHESCMSILKELDAIVAEFTVLSEANKQRRLPALVPTLSRMSIDSQASQEFFDADAGDTSQLLTIHLETDDEDERAHRVVTEDGVESASASDIEDADNIDRSATPGLETSLYPPKPRSLAPLPLQSVKRRSTVPPPTVSPPSLIGFLRKNVGKDLSTISMPVSANEPISLLQRTSEQLEYSELLDSASSNNTSSIERLLNVTAFAISSLSALRVKERAIRKPFNPMLGETFELVREDKGYRFIAEKVSHRPVRMACQADSEKWSFAQSPLPTQKFWGKSAELITEGRARVILHTTDERFSWTPPTCSLRNLLAGEKYVEPVGTISVTNETTNEQAIVTFKSKGMFSGRSEDVIVQTYDSFGDVLPLGLVGKWTHSLTLTKDGIPRPQPLWTVNSLPPDAAKNYGFTSFASSLNEITAHERQKTAPTDSRLRPDQRAAEEGDFNQAEALKAKLEEGQRERRRMLEEEGMEWRSRWFERVEGSEGEEVWRLRGGKEGYWEERSRGDWEGVGEIFSV